MRRLTLSSLVISLLVIASTAVLFYQTREAAHHMLLSRGLDRAGAIAVAARAVRPDDGVLDRLALGLQDKAVLFACFYTPDGKRLCPRDDPALAPAHERAMVQAAIDADSHASFHRPGLGGTGAFELWYLIDVGGAGPAGVERRFVPGTHASSQRVLLVVIDSSSASALVLQSLAHAVLITLALAVLVGLTVRQVRALAREQALAAERAAERRFAALGHLSAVLAHEIRNPLGAIKGFAQYTARRFADDDPARGDMEAVVAESTRLERLVHSLLLYARPLEPQRTSQDLREVVRRAARIIEREAGELGLQVEVTLPDAPVMARVDGEQLAQALLNLLANAMEAMEESGGQLALALHARDDGAEIVVSDRGAGIAPELLADIFEPYVTRKARGTGLGLAVVKRVVEAHDGRIEIESEVGQGTTMRVILGGEGADG